MRAARWQGWLVCGLAGLSAGAVSAQPVFMESLGSLQGADDGQFDTPRAVALDAAGNLYVADGGNARIQRFDLAGGTLTHAWTFGASGPTAGQFDGLYGLAVDASGNVYTTEIGTDRVQRFTQGGGSLVLDYAAGGFGAFAGQYDDPVDIAVDPAGDVYVVDRNNRRVQVLTPGTGTLNHVASFLAGGLMQTPQGVTVGPDGTIYIVDDTTDQMYTAARLGSVVGLTKVVPVPASNPMDVALNANGSLYLPTRDPDALRRFSYNGTSLTGNVTVSNVGLFPVGTPDDVAADAFGNVYVVDSDNHRVHRWFDPDAIAPGNIATLANLTVGNLSPSLTLAPGKQVNVTGTTLVEPGALLRVQTDQFVTQNLGVFGGTFDGRLVGVTALTFHSGTLKATDNAGLTIDAAGLTGGALNITPLKTLNITKTLTIDATGLLTLGGGAVTADTLVNNGTINANGATVTLLSPGSANNAAINITAGGLRLTHAFTNNARVTITGSAIRIDQAFINATTGQIDATGLSNLRFDGGLTNDGLINIDGGDTILNGSITNTLAGVIDLRNTAAVTFSAAITNDGTIATDAGSSAVYSNAYSGSGTITGTGLSTFSSSVAPGGDVAASMSVAGDVTLQGTLDIQIGGPDAGTGFDQLLVGGNITLGGTLVIELINGYRPVSGESFVILKAGDGVVTDGFSAVAGLTIQPDAAFELVYDEALDRVLLTAPIVLPGDTDTDGDIDNSDLQAAIGNFTGPQPDPPTYTKTRAQGDADADGDVDNSDLQASIGGFTGPINAAPVPVPEPASLVLPGLVGLLATHRRR